MSKRVAAAIGRPTPDDPERDFRCFCGERFPDRAHFDDSLPTDPDRFDVRDHFKRVLPRGSRTVDGNRYCVSVDETAEKALQAQETGSA